MIDNALAKLRDGQHLDMQQMRDVIGLIMEGRVPEERTAELLTELHNKGEAIAEIAGAAQAMRDHMTPLPTDRTDVIDIVGTGGDGAGTFNISTAVAIVTSACGVAVAKHGNVAITSKSGSANVLETLGVNVKTPVEQTARCLDEIGLCFCFAPMHHSAMRHVAPVRRSLPHPTVFNLLGPLTNPALAPYQLLGVPSEELQPRIAEVVRLLGTKRTLVVRGEDGTDEVSLSGPTHAIEVSEDQTQFHTLTPEDFELEPVALADLLASSPEESAEIIRDILASAPGPARRIVVAGTAAALWTMREVDSLATGAARAADAIDSGAAAQQLARLAELTCEG